jgi:AhpD family alkylhydroperoxidase
MTLSFPVHSLASAPEASKPPLAQLQQAFGMLPNIAGALANSPKLIGSLVGVFAQVHSGSLTEAEIQVVLLTDAVVNRCHYAVAFHSALAGNNGVSKEAVAAIRARSAPEEPRFAALSALATALIEKRGHLADADTESFARAGFQPEQILEVIGIVAASTITNYGATVAAVPLDEAFKNDAWE